MSMQRKVRYQLETLATMGLRERADARTDGVSSFYIDTSADDHIIEEKPNGTRVLAPFSPVAPLRFDSAE